MNKVITLTLILLLSLSGMAQTDKITIVNPRITLKQAFKELEAQSKYTIAYNQTKFDATRTISLSIQNQNVTDAMTVILNHTGFSYKIKGTHIILIPAPRETAKPKTIPRQTIRGVVTDATSGTPIPYATIILLNTIPRQGSVTDSLGRFRLDRLTPGRYDLQVSSVGFESLIIREILLTSSKEEIQEIRLKSSPQEIEEVVVYAPVNKGLPLNPMALTGGRMFSVEETNRFAGGFDDPARLVTSFAGVAGNFDNNGIAIRGNSPQSLQWRLEGVEIPNPTHYADMGSVGGGLFTALSSQVLGNSDFFNGAFPAEYSNALSGVFDMNIRNGNNEKHEHTVQIGLIGIDFASEGPFSKNNRSSYIFNYRYSTTGLVSPRLGLNFQDLSFKLNFPTWKTGTFSVWGIGLIDKHSTEAKKPEEWETYLDRQEDRTTLVKTAGGITHKYLFANDMYIKTTLATSYSKIDYLLDQFIHPDKQQTIRISDMQSSDWNLILHSYINKKFGSRHINRTGFTVTQLQYDLDYKESPAPGLNTPTRQVAKGKGNSTVISAFSNSVFNLTTNLTANVGITAQLFTLNNNWTVEPRVSLKWQFSPVHSFAFAHGMHSRREKLDYYFVEQPNTGDNTVNKNLDFSKAHHFTFTYDWKISPYIHLKIEPYFQYLYDVPVEKFSSFSIINHNAYYLDRVLINAGKGKNYGIDLTLERYLNKGYYYLLTGSAFSSRYSGGDHVWRNTCFDRNFLFNALGGKEWLCGKHKQNMFGTNIRFSYQGGDRYTPVDETKSALKHEIILNENEAFSRQFPAQLSVDLSFNYRINKKSSSHEFGLKILNLTGDINQHNYEFNEIKNRVEKKTIKGLLPNITYKIQF